MGYPALHNASRQGGQEDKDIQEGDETNGEKNKAAKVG